MSTDLRPRALLASLVPLAAFIGAIAAGEPFAEHEVHLEWSGLVAALPFYVLVVVLPAALPLVVARHRATQAVVLVAMTTTATLAGWLVVTTDDAQAGLAVLWVPFVAIPLALAIRVAQHAARWLQPSRSRDRVPTTGSERT